MGKIRVYGDRPYGVVLVHGGPGGGGEMGGIGRELGGEFGVLEPFQEAGSVWGQVDELAGVLEEKADGPAVLVGYSWGAWLVYLLAGARPELVKKLVLVSSGPFEACWTEGMQAERLGRLSAAERAEVERLMAVLGDSTVGAAEKRALFGRFGALFGKADGYDVIEDGGEDEVELRVDIYERVWPEAAAMRASGELLELGRRVECPVVAIHGDYDPHPAAGVEGPLSRVLGDFRFVLLEHCGHKPWMERQARERFYEELRAALDANGT